jgi:hypothetical protein
MFPGGIRKSSKFITACNCSNFRRATLSMFPNLREGLLLNKSSVSAQENERIIQYHIPYNRICKAEHLVFLQSPHPSKPKAGI